jgi:3',5'-cyclic AMP phosphodiesterase CpdA
MRTLLHLSDFHFGRIDERVLKPLLDAVGKINPNIVVVSGDLTQRARAKQFRAASELLKALPLPQIIVPGNHDVPLYNVIARFLFPLAGYRRYIAKDPEPFYQDEEIAILGLNSSRSLTIQDGRLNKAQIGKMMRVFKTIPDGVLKVLVSHHPFELPPDCEEFKVVGGAGKVLDAMAECRTDVVLSGHFHTTHVGRRAFQQPDAKWAPLLLQAGTATSTRLRGQEPSFNVLHVRGGTIELESHTWSNDTRAYLRSAKGSFNRGPFGWSNSAEETA